MSTVPEKLDAADFINRSQQAVRRYYGEALVAAAQADDRIVCLTADLAAPTETDLFRDTLPDRHQNVGIAEANMIGMAGGMARAGEIPFVHSFCAFVTKRAYDQITMQCAYPNLPVKLVGFLPGVATLLGVSHQAIEDLAIMRAVPNFLILEPSGPEYFGACVTQALAHDGPVYLRMMRPEQPPEGEVVQQPLSEGKGIVRREGKDVTLLAIGLGVAESLKAADELAAEGIDATVADMAFIKPLDEELIIRLAQTTGAIVTAENHSIIGGLGSAVAEVLAGAGIGLPFRRVGVNDRFCEGGTTPYLLEKYGLDSTAIAAAARAAVAQKT